MDGRARTDAEIVSTARDWTADELGTIAASIGIIVVCRADHAHVEARPRSNRSAIPTAIDEILRIDAPLIANRHVTAHPRTLAGAPLPDHAGFDAVGIGEP